jgi:sterol desaturase/sphingolipid hydroxylase (fatty acid hydroxylase superfamily)
VSVEEQAGRFPLANATTSVAAAATFRDPDAARRRTLIAFGYYFVLVAMMLHGMDSILPDRITVIFFGRVYSTGNIHNQAVGACLFAFIIVPAAIMGEMLIVGWVNSSLRHLLFVRTPSSRSDLIVFLLWQCHVMAAVQVLLTFGIALLSGLWIHDWLLAQTGFDLGLSAMPAPIAFAGYVLLFTFFDYWTHRLDHTRYFWPSHRYHHSAEDFYVITSNRGTPGVITARLASTIPLGILGMPPATAFWIYILVGTHHLVIHSRIDSDFGWAGRYLLQSPVHHRLHHIRDRSFPTAHFSLLPVWDHLFGTWRGGGSQRIVIGVDVPYRHGFWVLPDLWRDYREFITGFFPAGFFRRR